jgi:hypothetical protein
VSSRGEGHCLELLELLLLLKLYPLGHVSDGSHDYVRVAETDPLVEDLQLLLKNLSIDSLLVCIVGLSYLLLRAAVHFLNVLLT